MSVCPVNADCQRPLPILYLSSSPSQATGKEKENENENEKKREDTFARNSPEGLHAIIET